MYKLRHIESDVIHESTAKPVWVNGMWECGLFRLTDVEMSIYELIEPVPIVDRRVTRLAFRKRFTQSEKVAIELAALDDPAATVNERAKAAALRVDMKDTDSATFIDLDRPDTREGVLALELFGLLDEGRALEILDAEIQPVERPQ